MNVERGTKRRWLASAAGAVVIVAALVALFRFPRDVSTAPKNPPPPPMPSVKLVTLSRNEAALTDPTPLFLPTEWNAGQDPLPAEARREPGSSFAGYPAKLKFAETELALEFPPDVVAPSRPADALSAGKVAQIFLGLGPDDKGLTQLHARKGFVEITDARNGQRVLAEPLTDASPPVGAAWQPIEFLVAVDAMGLVGPPILTESSSVVAVDGYFQNYVGKTLRAGQRLTPGFYRICVGP